MNGISNRPRIRSVSGWTIAMAAAFFASACQQDGVGEKTQAAVEATTEASAEIAAQPADPQWAAALEAGYSHPGEQIYQESCAVCHNNAEDLRAPNLAALQRMSSPQLVFALKQGKMREQAAHLGRQDLRYLLEYLAPGGAEGYTTPTTAMCESSDISFAKVDVGLWGVDAGNSRYVSEAQTSLTRDNIKNLELAWVFGAPAVTEMRSYPVITEDTLFMTTVAGDLFALDRKTGCTKWHQGLKRPIRSPLTLGDIDGRPTLFMQDALAKAIAIDAATGEMLWISNASIGPTTIGTAGVVQADDLVIVPLSNADFGAAADPKHECCKGHGGVVALKAETGEHVWTAHMTEDAVKQGVSSVGTQLWGPSGAPVWTTPAIDLENGRVFIGTGENTSAPATDTSDSIIALDLKTGTRLWVYQATQMDMYNGACSGMRASGPNCPTPTGPDFDFGGGVSLAKLSDGRNVVVGGQKSGDVHVVDAATGELIWKKKISAGSPLGGIHWGVSVSNGRIFAPSNDPEFPFPNYKPNPGLFTLDLDTGEELWKYELERGCKTSILALANQATPWPECSFQYGMSATPTSNDDVVFAPSLDGMLRAFDVETGELLWSYDTVKEFTAVNGVPTHGGAVDNAGVAMSGDMIFVMSGYSLFNQMPGNALLAFKVK